MARTKTSVEYSNFTNGFITEASPLTFPENASLDEVNVNINKDGSRQRRFGMDWTDTAVPKAYVGGTLASTGYATSSFTWKSAGNDGENTFGVLQRGRDLFFHDLDVGDPGNSLIFSSTLTAAECPDPTQPLEYTSANGKLLIAGGGVYVSGYYWTGSAVAKSTPYQLAMRDRFGINDSLAITSRPATLSATHEYNLRNQGWPNSTLCANGMTGQLGSPILADPLAQTFTNMGWYPSNADLVWASKIGAISGTGAANIENLDTFSSWELEKQFFGTTPAPKGKFAIDIFDRSSSRIGTSGVSGLTTDITVGGINAIASFAGRVWYGVREDYLTGGDNRSPHLGNMIFYSISSTDEDRWKQCHTDNDPTEEDLGDVLNTNYGEIISLMFCRLMNV